VYVTPGRHPFEVGPLLACALVGGGMALFRLRPPSIVSGLGEPILTVWLALVAVGGVVGLVGCFWRGAVTDGLLVEFAGVLAVGMACLLYVAAIFAANRFGAAFASGGLLAGIAFGALGRAAQCAIEYRRVRRGVTEQVRVDLPLIVEPEPGGDR
jgi:hypothetical protein